MKIIIPASGTGERFKEAGYKNTKPLIDVLPNKKIIDYVIDVFDKENDEFYFILGPSTFDEMSSYIETLNIKSEYILYEGDKLGPIGAIQGSNLSEFISADDEVIISYCDFGMEWNYQDFLEFVDSEKPDGAIPCYSGFHPHLIPDENVYAACMTIGNDVFEVKEKYKSSDKFNELWSPGVYYFKSFELMRTAFERTINAKDMISGEYYVSLAYNHLKDYSVKVYNKITKFYQFGTPKDFEHVKHNLNMLENFKNEESEIENVIVLAAGKGERFLNLGYKLPKPFLPLGNTDLITKISESFDSKITYIASNDHRIHWEQMPKDSLINYIEANKIGAAWSYLQGASDINGEVLIVPCDLIAKHITEEFNELKKTTDVIVFTADATVYALKNPNSFAWVKGDNNIIEEISVKKRLNTHKEQMVLIGSFWVKENKFLLENIKEIIDSGNTVKGEHYLDSAFKNMLEKTNVGYIKLDKYFSLGTPSEYANSAYWLE